MRVVSAAFASLALLSASPPESSIGLPAVTGDRAVGRFTESWTDSSRTEETALGTRPRSVGVQF